MMATALPPLTPGDAYVVTLLSGYTGERTVGRYLHRAQFNGLIACTGAPTGRESHVLATDPRDVPNRERVIICRYCWGKL